MLFLTFLVSLECSKTQENKKNMNMQKYLKKNPKQFKNSLNLFDGNFLRKLINFLEYLPQKAVCEIYHVYPSMG